mmetsp:Transcript_31772/g.53588  ORF Transcript_31772/g.53588 Transcript_31772/m.53588 type:complete len:406 (+) Transcript_31772:36-1253(+)
MNELNSYISQINELTARLNGVSFAKLIALPVIGGFEPSHNDKQFIEKTRRVDPVSFCQNKCHDENAAPIIAYRLLALRSLVDDDLAAAYQHESSAYNATLEYFSLKDEDTAWTIPVLVRVSNDLRIVATMADEKAGDTNYKFLRESLNSLTKGFTNVAKDRSGSKRAAIFAVTNALFKIYFKVNTLQLCGKLINVVEGPSGIMNQLQSFPVSDVVMYKYYIGRLKMFEDRYTEARECLRFALNHCPIKCIKNRQRILASLVPVEMCLGVMPGEKIGSVYGLTEFVEFGQATIRGDIGTFDRLLQQHQATLVRLGVYLVLEQVKMIAYRNLFLRIFRLQQSTRLNLHSFHAALRWMGEDTDLDEIECVIGNLIYQNKIKGYISHEKRFLIVSKTDPFPKAAVVKKA